MKKLLCIILSLIMVLSLAACGAPKEEVGTVIPDDNPIEAPNVETPDLGGDTTPNTNIPEGNNTLVLQATVFDDYPKDLDIEVKIRNTLVSDEVNTVILKASDNYTTSINFPDGEREIFSVLPVGYTAETTEYHFEVKGHTYLLLGGKTEIAQINQVSAAVGSQHIHQVNIQGLSGQIKQILQSRSITNDYYVLTNDNKLYLVSNNGQKVSPIDMKETFGLKGDFETIIEGINNFQTTLIVVKDNRLYTATSGLNYYFKPQADYILFEHQASQKILDIQYINPETNKWMLQRCYEDGTIEEYEVQFGEHKGSNFVEYDIEVKQIIPQVGKDRLLHGLTIMDTNGKFYGFAMSAKFDKENMIAKWQINPQEDVFKITNHQFKNIDYLFYATDLDKAIYSEVGNTTELKLMVDYAKNETVSIPLPSGYTTSDINKVYHDDEDIIVIFNDNSVYYSLEDTIETLTKSDELTDINKNGILNTMKYVGDQYLVVLDDSNVYQVEVN